MRPILFIAGIIILSLSIAVKGQQPVAKHVVLIGIDGVSAEGFQYASTPVMDNLIGQGSVSLKTRGVMPTVSAPNWSTILSGAGPEQHGVTSNEWSLGNQGFEPTVKDADGYFTSIFTLIRNQLPKAVTGMFYDWEWLGTFVNRKNITKEQFVQGYEFVTSKSIQFIKKEKPVFTFIYYGHPDEIGHTKGHGTKEYFQSINDIDTQIGNIITALKETGIYENTTLIITSDHGGIGFGHGGESMVEIEVPWIISGPGIKKNTLLELPNDLMNTSPTIARILGLKTPPEWIGSPVNEAFATKNKISLPKQFVPKPWCSLSEKAYSGTQQVELTSKWQETEIFYTLDGSVPGTTSKKYSSPFTISSNCLLKAVSIFGNNSSQVITRQFTFIQGVKSATLTFEPSDKYPGSGVLSLFDGLTGSSNYKNKQWMGFEGGDFEVTADLGEMKTVKSMAVDVLQLPASWIFLPMAVEFYISDDGRNFTLINTFYPAETDDIRLDGPVMLNRNFDNLRSRFIRIKAINMGTCPEGHPGAGQKAWLFVSEVEVE